MLHPSRRAKARERETQKHERVFVAAPSGASRTIARKLKESRAKKAVQELVATGSGDQEVGIEEVEAAEDADERWVFMLGHTRAYARSEKAGRAR